MRPGFIETAMLKEIEERKAYWNAELARLGRDDKYHAVAHDMPGIPRTRYLGIFIEEKKPAGNGTAESHLP